jgi:hypothetical protein
MEDQNDQNRNNLKKQSSDFQHDDIKKHQNTEDNKGGAPAMMDNDSFNNNRKMQKSHKAYENNQEYK